MLIFRSYARDICWEKVPVPDDLWVKGRPRHYRRSCFLGPRGRIVSLGPSPHTSVLLQASLRTLPRYANNDIVAMVKNALRGEGHLRLSIG